jgi:hypothetical protein
MSIPKTIDEARWALLDELGVSHEHLRALEQRLDGDYTVHAYGYEQFADLGDVRLRAVVSDQLLRTVRAVGDNLLAAGLHRERLGELAGEGRTMPKGPDTVAVLRDSSAIDMALSGFFAALPSALDCLAGVAIAVLRMPKSITKADINDLRPLGTKQQATGTPTQQQTWSDLAAFADAQQATLPSGWFDWLMAMRNLMTHRASQERILLQQTIEKGEPQLAVVTDTPSDVTDTWRFDLHLRKRPALPDMQDFTVPGAITDLWIAERATDTVAAILLLATGFVEALAERLLDIWECAAAAPSDYPAPAAFWVLTPEPGPSFDGITGAASAFRPGGGLAHAQLGRRLDLAQRVLRETRPAAKPRLPRNAR